MAFKLNEKTLEPENGDYIEFLKEIEKGNARVQGLTVTVSDETPGMVAVRRANELSGDDSSAVTPAKKTNKSIVFASLFMGIGLLLTLFGVLFIASGMLEPSLQNLIPIGMFATFGGLVCTLSNRQKLERLKRLEQQKSSNNQNNQS